MTRAYSRNYLWDAKQSLARMMDFATNDLRYDPAEFFDMFIRSGIAELFGTGDPHYIAGMSGYELAYEVLEESGVSFDREKEIEYNFDLPLSPEYWAGWALAHYQWYSGRSFAEITAAVPIDDIIMMYHPYHEMDISHFLDDMEEMLRERQTARKRKKTRLCGGRGD